MPLQNRVNPFGEIFRTPARGTFMGNRGGALHNDDREIVRAYKSVMSPNRYTELFFLDEAVAFAAGHRPCAECRHERFVAFKTAWRSANPPGADEMDAELHRARIDARRKKVTYSAPLDSLPDGSFISIEGHPWLVYDDALLLWTPEGYTKKIKRPRNSQVTVLTPRPIVECFRNGYRPEIHDSSRTL